MAALPVVDNIRVVAVVERTGSVHRVAVAAAAVALPSFRGTIVLALLPVNY